MDIYVLDTNFNKLSIVDAYESVLWIDRFSSPGEIEIYIPADKKFLSYLKQGNYLVHKDSEHVIVIEGVKIETSVDDGNKIIIRGRSIESILDRRIIWRQTDFNNVYLQTAVQRLLNENVISPSISARGIPNFIFEASTDPAITKLKLSAQYTGDNLLEVIEEICDANHIGFKVTLNASNKFVFKLYTGIDRSYNQTDNTYVVFSPEFDNIINSNYYESDATYKNVTLVAGEGEGLDRLTYTVGNASGLDRREFFTDARDISTTDEDNNPIPISEYNEKLRQRGLEKLSEETKEKTFDGKVDSVQMYVFGRDFFMGDVVQIRNEFGLEGSARIIEYIMSENVEEGLQYYPTFEAIQDEVEE